ncbi:hypothetical protein E2562_021843 [Oryza meyeriana var. granulata]|uniref:Uncharacterized protein n=1 Tax=Oryza meyeriana var. granulata TaxID=110450 RepID=A0A6G1ENE4_9ORYZ|nr:hypothetical protein E2562_021843 [Oryza meyeriana var. granulata]
MRSLAGSSRYHDPDLVTSTARKLESLVRAAKVVYDHDVAEVERLSTALTTERDEAVATKEQAEKAAEAFKSQQALSDALKVWASACIQQAKDHKLVLAHCEEAVAEWEVATSRREEGY